MNQAQKKKFERSQADVYKRIEGFENNGTIPCENPSCVCKGSQLAVKTFSVVVTPDFDILLTCTSAAIEYAKRQNMRGNSF